MDPVVRAFMQGDSRSGEVVIRPSSTGPETTVMVRKLTPDETWWVLGATTANLQLQSPKWNASIASPVRLSGQSAAFEATVNVQVRQDGTLIPLASSVVMGGSMGQMGPFSKAVSFSKPTAKRGALILKTLSVKDGNIVEATVLRIQFTDLANVIKSALDTGNLSELRPYLAHSVDYAIAASGAYGTISPEGAIKQLSYFKDDHGPWSFAIPAPTLQNFKSGSYRRYLANDTYFGVSAGKGFISVRVNSAGQIDKIFMAINTDLLK
ncbi:MAG: Gmad2 immunoglobulin-like domain-containing protein [Gaiellaceae bacterium]